MKNQFKKFTIFFFVFILSVCSMNTPVSAQININNDEPINTCKLPRNTGNEQDEEFIEFIEGEINISRDDENVFIQYNGDNTTSVTVVESPERIVIYSTLDENTQKLLQDNPEISNQKGILWTALVWLWKMVNTAGSIATGCDLIQGVSGVNVCGRISKAVIDNLIEVGTRKRYKVINTIERKYCPYPPHSLQCNQPPFAYEKIVLQAY